MVIETGADSVEAQGCPPPVVGKARFTSARGALKGAGLKAAYSYALVFRLRGEHLMDQIFHFSNCMKAVFVIRNKFHSAVQSCGLTFSYVCVTIVRMLFC